MIRYSASVLTLVKGRERHLQNLLESLSYQTTSSFEVIIASMQLEPVHIPANLPYPVRVVQLDIEGDALPLAAARNRAAAEASADTLIFLDVDCIATPTLVAAYVEQVRKSARCLMGEVRYLPESAPVQGVSAVELDLLLDASVAHPARPQPPETGWQEETNPRSLWGLSFALPRELYFRAEGMDENFRGWGGEETDFAERLAGLGGCFGWCARALALHQYHPVYHPPLDKLNDIVRNATYFHQQWGNWCLEYWLEHFSRLGYIEWDADADAIAILRRPSAEEISATRQPPEIAFS